MSKEQQGVEVIRKALKTMPDSPGVYRMVNADGAVLYVGKAKSLPKRVQSYTHIERLPYRLQRMVFGTASMDITVTDTEAEALLLEANLIKSLKPRYNILLKDDKSFPFIYVDTSHPYPRITKHRGAKKGKGKYFGPFASVGDLNQTITYLQRIFLLRPCSDSMFSSRERPCLEYQIKRCSGPCVGKISDTDYAHLLRDAMDFLSGKSRALQQRLTADMEAASAAMEYEQAALYRDRIKALTSIQLKQHVSFDSIKNADVIGVYQEHDRCAIQVFFFRGGQHYGNTCFFPDRTESMTAGDILTAFIGQFYHNKMPPPYLLVSHTPSHLSSLEEALSSIAEANVHISRPRRGDKYKAVQKACDNAKEALARKLAELAHNTSLLQEVAAFAGVEGDITRIEVYDNSHTQGDSAIGGMVVLGPDGFMKPHYRKFTIKSRLTPGDDYAMMREVLTRRFKRLRMEHPDYETGVWPDVILIDGGKGHLSTVQEVFDELGVTGVQIICISKGPARKVGDEFYHRPGKAAVQLPASRPLAHYFQQARDEAHRYAIGSHRKKRGGASSVSALDEIPGIGATRKRALLSHFGSVKALAGAKVDDLVQVPGINHTMAKQILNWLR